MSIKRFLAYLYRTIPLPYWIQCLAVRLVAPTFLVGVVGVVFDEDNNVLLLEHIFHRPISWGLPGGWLDRGESPEDALRREIFEETGLKVIIEQMLIFEPSTDPKQLQISYLCKHTGDQTFRLSNEIASAKWFATSSTPSKLLSFHRRSIQAGLRSTRSDSAQSNHSLNFNG